MLEPRLLAAGAIHSVTTPLAFVSATHLEPKWSGGFCHIVDLQPLNQFLTIPKVKAETLSFLPLLSKPGDARVMVDMEQGYYSLGIVPEFQQFMCFQVGSTWYECTALPMGLSIAPLVYSKMVWVVASFLC